MHDTYVERQRVGVLPPQLETPGEVEFLEYD